MSVTDNQFEDTLVQLNGEGYLEDVTLDNLHSLNNANDAESESITEDDLIGKCSRCGLHSAFVYSFSPFGCI